MNDSVQTRYARAKQMAAYPLVIVAIGAEELANPPFRRPSGAKFAGETKESGFTEIYQLGKCTIVSRH